MDKQIERKIIPFILFDISLSRSSNNPPRKIIWENNNMVKNRSMRLWRVVCIYYLHWNIIRDSVWSHMNNWITPARHSLKLGNSIRSSRDSPASHSALTQSRIFLLKSCLHVIKLFSREIFRDSPQPLQTGHYSSLSGDGTS